MINFCCQSLLVYSSIIILTVYVVKRFLKRQYNLPPGPKPWPIIGSLPDPYSTPWTYKTLMSKWVKEYGDVVMFKRLGMNFVYVNDYKLGHEAFVQNHAVDLSGRPTNGVDRLSVGNNDVFFTRSMDETYVELRKLVMSHLRKSAEPKRMIEISNICFDSFAQYIRDKKMDNNQTGFYVEPICYWLGHNLLAQVFYSDIIDYEDKEYQGLVKDIENLMGIIADFGIYDITPLNCLIRFKQKEVLQYSHKISNRILSHLNERRDTRLYVTDPKYFIDYGLQVQDNQKANPEKYTNLPQLNDEYLSNLALDIYFAGLDAFGIGFTWTIGLLALHPDVQSKIRQELEAKAVRNNEFTVKGIDELHYLNCVVAEILRYHSLSAFTSFHRAQKDVKIGGYDIPKDTIVALNVYGSHFDPRYWDEPEKFKPERFLNSENKYQLPREGFMPFGIGRRICVAERYVVKESQAIITARLCREFEIIWSKKNKDAELEEDKTNTFFRHTSEFFVEFKPIN